MKGISFEQPVLLSLVPSYGLFFARLECFLLDIVNFHENLFSYILLSTCGLFYWKDCVFQVLETSSFFHYFLSMILFHPRFWGVNSVDCHQIS